LVPIRLPSNAFVIRVPHEPQGKERPRVNDGHAITPAATVAAERAVWGEFLQRYAGCSPLDEPVWMGCEFRTARSRKGSRGRWDLDNLVKLVKDALNLHAYTDDHWVHGLYARIIPVESNPGSLIAVAAIRDITWFEIPLAGE
jgi:Holliday junction resolvase RusA-like endonuclease